MQLGLNNLLFLQLLFACVKRLMDLLDQDSWEVRYHLGKTLYRLGRAKGTYQALEAINDLIAAGLGSSAGGLVRSLLQQSGRDLSQEELDTGIVAFLDPTTGETHRITISPEVGHASTDSSIRQAAALGQNLAKQIAPQQQQQRQFRGLQNSPLLPNRFHRKRKQQQQLRGLQKRAYFNQTDQWFTKVLGQQQKEPMQPRPRQPQSGPEELLAPLPPSATDGERRISAWVSERPEDVSVGAKNFSPLRPQQTYTLNFKVGQPVPQNLLEGPWAAVADADVPPQGLPTEWLVTSHTVKLEPGTPDTSVTSQSAERVTVWTATFSLLIPKAGESAVVQLRITPLVREGASLDIVIYAEREIYRRFTVQLATYYPKKVPWDMPQDQTVTIRNELLVTRLPQLNIGSTHEWTTPPGELSITVIGTALAHVRGDCGPAFVNQTTKWHGVQAKVAGLITNVRASAERFRATWEDYLNDIDPQDLSTNLTQWTPEYDWSALSDHGDPAHRESWDAVKVSPEFRDLAFDGHRLFEAFFPAGSDLRTWLNILAPGHRLDISWLPTSGADWIPHIPWGLMFLPDVPQPQDGIDPTGFLALRFRLGYTSHEVQAGSKDLGRLENTHRIHLLYWGDQPQDTTGLEARWQRQQWAAWQNQLFVPPAPAGPEAKAELLKMLEEPGPAPATLLYLFCQCSVGQGNDPLLRFGGTSQASEVLRRTELGTKNMPDRPLVFANACTTAATDPYIANELEEGFFNRGCRAYIGTESKVPIGLASRFAAVFFHFFYRQLDPAPMAAGEAVAQTRLFLWTRYRNIGGLFYSYVNQYELFMATDDEVQCLRR